MLSQKRTGIGRGFIGCAVSREQNAAAFDQEREQLEWQASEISALNFSLDEWQALQAEHSRFIPCRQALLEATQMGLEALSEGESAALSQVNSVISRLSQVLDCDSNLKVVLDLLEPAQIQLQESVYELGRYQQRLDLDPQRLQEIEDRLAAIHATARKYRVVPAELPDLLQDGRRAAGRTGPQGRWRVAGEARGD